MGVGLDLGGGFRILKKILKSRIMLTHADLSDVLETCYVINLFASVSL